VRCAWACLLAYVNEEGNFRNEKLSQEAAIALIALFDEVIA
jgi:hypothetical protein